MDPDEKWSEGCPDCTELREELVQLRKDMRVAVTSYEARLREEVARYQTLLAMIETLHQAARGTLPPADAVFNPLDADVPPKG